MYVTPYVLRKINWNLKATYDVCMYVCMLYVCCMLYVVCMYVVCILYVCQYLCMIDMYVCNGPTRSTRKALLSHIQSDPFMLRDSLCVEI